MTRPKCLHREAELRTLSRTLRSQCLECGKALPGTLQQKDLPPAALALLKPWERPGMPVRGKPNSKARERTKRYRAADWPGLRQRTAARANWMCQKCGEPTGLEEGECHHLTYARLGDERPSDLSWYCRSCHRSVSGVWGQFK